MRLKDKVAIITGAGQGIGRAAALRFAEEGAKVAVADIQQGQAEAVAGEIVALGGEAIPIFVDVADRPSVDAMVQRVLDEWGQIDILINNAGILRDARLVKMTEADFDAVISVNLKGVFNCTQAVAPHMIERGTGRIINTSSVVGLYGNFGQTNYVAAKAGVIGMTKVWARELGRKGITVNAVAPGFIATEMIRSIPEKIAQAMIEKIPLGRMGQPEDIANAYLWLASDEASYVNGAVISVDGGVVV
ncbi:MAG TPA: 3-oxoacyl-[acyl-carrier-protein] reductase [Chloroflexi bacterium]|nr:3-oxoacyl-[acyl-carrier-protein] reductase [Chloroflexota bacterium]